MRLQYGETLEIPNKKNGQKSISIFAMRRPVLQNFVGQLGLRPSSLQQVYEEDAWTSTLHASPAVPNK